MAEAKRRSSKTKVPEWQPATPTVTVRSSLFKYYIHDTNDALRLELLGELGEPDVPDLNGCWQTAKTTLVKRKLVLDLRKLKTIDDAGKQWLARMADEGATYLPDTYLRTGLAGQKWSSDPDTRPTVKSGPLGRLLSMFRGSSIAAAE